MITSSVGDRAAAASWKASTLLASTLIIALAWWTRTGRQEFLRTTARLEAQVARERAHWVGSWAAGDSLPDFIQVTAPSFTESLAAYGAKSRFVLLTRRECDACQLTDDLIREFLAPGASGPSPIEYRLDTLMRGSEEIPALQLPASLRPTFGVPTLLEFDAKGVLVGVAHASSQRVLRRLESAGVLSVGAASQGALRASATSDVLSTRSSSDGGTM